MAAASAQRTRPEHQASRWTGSAPSVKCPDEVVPRAPWISKNIILPTNFISVRNRIRMLLPTPGHRLEKQEERERSADALHYS